MTMMNKDTLKQQKMEIVAGLREAAKEGNDEQFATQFSLLTENLEQKILLEAKEIVQSNDKTILASRGMHPLTSVEQKFYENIIQASKASDVKQALSGLDVVMPETIIDKVFEDIKINHPLLSKIDFRNTTAITKIFTSENGTQKGIWGKLTTPIVQELLGQFVERNMTLMKLTAFIPVSKDMLDLGPQYIDRYVREILFEAIACGLEDAIVCGDGKDKFIGMDRYVGEDVSVTGGIYPEKEKIKVKRFDPKTVGKIVSLIATDKSGKPRAVTGLGLLVNPQDYYLKVMPATTIMAPDGTYRNDVMPIPMDIIQTIALPKDKAIIGMMSKMFAGAGMEKNGKIEFSDEYQFLEDNRVYIDKLYANGFPLDNNAFQVLDISELEALKLVVETSEPTPSDNDAKLNALSFGNAKLSPAFNKDTKVYTATTTAATNSITAIPSNAETEIIVKVNENVISNGEAATWNVGENTVVISTKNGTGTETYTITVTKTES